MRHQGSNRCYVYTIAYPDGTVFYVGEGRYERIDQHEQEARRGVQSPKCDVIREIWASGGQVLKKKVAENLKKWEARQLEAQLIEHYGKENLTNRTKRTEVQIQSISEGHKASWARRKAIKSTERIHQVGLVR